MSRAGWIGAVTVVGLQVGGMVLFARWHATNAIAAWTALSTLIWAPGIVIAVGALTAAAVVRRRAPADLATWREWALSWWQEWQEYYHVFVWRQPFRWRAWADPAEVTEGPTVVLVHGYLCNRGFWHPWMKTIQQRGWHWRSVNLEPVFGSIDDMVDVLDPVMRQALHGGRPVAVVAHSMGGLVIRAWLARQPVWPAGLKACITIGSPHRGTWVARLAHSPAARQMRENSPWLQALERSERADDAQRYLCWRSLTDHVVYPPPTACLSGAEDRVIRCAGHVDLAFQPQVMGESLDRLASAFRSPAERTCA